jgi:hypothetical protein
VSLADTYRAMSDDVGRAAKDTDNEGVRRAYLALAELWRKAAARADGFPIPADEYAIPDWQESAGASD